MDWKRFLAFITPVLVFGVLGFLRIIPPDLFPILQIIAAITGFSLADFLKPRIDLKIENIKLERRQVLKLKGYFVSAEVINKGKKIAVNITPKITIENVRNEELIDKAMFFIVKKKEKGEGMGFRTMEVPLDDMHIDFPGFGGLPLIYSSSKEFNRLRKDDCVSIRYPRSYKIPEELKLDKIKTPFRGWFLQLEPQEKYKVTIKLTAEDLEKNSLTVEKTKTITPSI
jgi:hypothetical protein